MFREIFRGKETVGAFKIFRLWHSHAACQKTFSVRISEECPAPDVQPQSQVIGPYPQTPVFLK
jgi:hypothetical protein